MNFFFSSRRTLAFLLCAMMLPQAHAVANTGLEAIVLPSITKDPKIAGLEISPPRVAVQLIRYQGKGTVYQVAVAGKFTRGSDWTLMADRRRIPVSEDGTFSAKFWLNGLETPIAFTAIGPLGDVEKQRVVVSFPRWGRSDVVSRKEADEQRKRLNLSFGLGLTSLNHTEEGANPYSSTLLTVKASYNKIAFPPHWDLGLSGFGTALQISRSRADASMRSFGANFRLGYILPSVKEPWRIVIYTGIYYLTMSVAVDPASVAADSRNQFGFGNVSGMQLYPTFRRSLSGGRALSFYGKYSPVNNKFQILSLTSRELATGLAYVIPIRSDRNLLGFSFDYANVKIDLVNPAGDTAKISQNSMSLGMSYGF